MREKNRSLSEGDLGRAAGGEVNVHVNNNDGTATFGTTFNNYDPSDIARARESIANALRFVQERKRALMPQVPQPWQPRPIVHDLSGVQWDEGGYLIDNGNG